MDNLSPIEKVNLLIDMIFTIIGTTRNVDEIKKGFADIRAIWTSVSTKDLTPEQNAEKDKAIKDAKAALIAAIEKAPKHPVSIAYLATIDAANMFGGNKAEADEIKVLHDQTLAAAKMTVARHKIDLEDIIKIETRGQKGNKVTTA